MEADDISGSRFDIRCSRGRGREGQVRVVREERDSGIYVVESDNDQCTL